MQQVRVALEKGLSTLVEKSKKTVADKKKEASKVYYSDFQMLLKEQTSNIDTLLADLDEDNETFKGDLKTYEDAHDELE